MNEEELEDFKVRFSKHLVDQVFKMIELQEKDKGDKIAKELFTHFLACYIGAFLFESLYDSREKVKRKKNSIELAEKEFKELKNNIQNSVAAGFQGALSAWSGVPVEYYCQIKVIPEVANKQPC